MVPHQDAAVSRSFNPMEPREIIQVEPSGEVAGCNGGGGALGHPLVYLRFDGKASVDCYYCSRRFVKSEQPSEPPDGAASH
jgi:uncharacterized Zn-finger protein